MSKDEMPSVDQLVHSLEVLEALRKDYEVEVRQVVRQLRARYAKDHEQAYWIGVAQGCSNRIANDLQALEDALYGVKAAKVDIFK